MNSIVGGYSSSDGSIKISFSDNGKVMWIDDRGSAVVGDYSFNGSTGTATFSESGKYINASFDLVGKTMYLNLEGNRITFQKQ